MKYSREAHGNTFNLVADRDDMFREMTFRFLAAIRVFECRSRLNNLPDRSNPMSLRILFCALYLSSVLCGVNSYAVAESGAEPSPWHSFLKNHCYDCHTGAEAEAGLDLTALGAGLSDPQTQTRWVQIFDRVQKREMPPKEASSLQPKQRAEFLKATGNWLRQHQTRQQRQMGRVRGRRLTNLQVERTLHDLLGIDIPLANQLPEDGRPFGFSTVADGQSMSHFQLERHLAIVDLALDEAFRRAVSPPDEREWKFTAKEVARSNPDRRTREPELLDNQAVVWAARTSFYGRLPATTARYEGWYRFVIRASALNRPEDHGVWCSIRSGRCVSSAPLMTWVGAFEATDQPQEIVVEAWLPRGHMLEVRPADSTLKLARFQGGQVGTGEGGPQHVPGVAIHSMTMERIHQGADNQQIKAWLFGDLRVQGGRGKRPARVFSKMPRRDAAQLMLAFANRAFRRPVSANEIAPYVEEVKSSLNSGTPLAEAIRGGYRALLCSPRFLYFHEEPGPLDNYAIASRLSYFLWNSMPDAVLMRLASSGKLQDRPTLHRQVERMLADERGEEFLKDFAAQWLDLSEINFTQPDSKLYRDFDPIVQQSMLDETHAFLQYLLNENLSVSNLIDSDFTFLNSRLARYYDIDNVSGDELRKVSLRPQDRRGGVLTQGAILKVTANGTTTSPVIRGVWVSERLLGEPIPPPPKNVPAIEPDIRGATTIREMLAKHRNNDQCASCHVKIDPPGFALENYDPAGQWRDRYFRGGRGGRSRGVKINASYKLADGRPFQDVDGFRTLVLTDPDNLARNVAEKMLTYGTGAPIRFTDRRHVKKIVEQAAEKEFGFRSLLHAVVASPVFLQK